MSLGEILLKFFAFYGINNDWTKKKIIMINVNNSNLK
jgi:hypothetical protein